MIKYIIANAAKTCFISRFDSITWFPSFTQSLNDVEMLIESKEMAEIIIRQQEKRGNIDLFTWFPARVETTRTLLPD